MEKSHTFTPIIDAKNSFSKYSSGNRIFQCKLLGNCSNCFNKSTDLKNNLECSDLASDEWGLITGKIQNLFYNALASISFFGMKESCESGLELICNTSTMIGSQQTKTVPFGRMHTIGGPVG